MATETRHAPGTFCWPELATTDQNGAKQFYTSIMGWAFKDMDMGPDGVYTIFQIDGADVAALYTQREAERKAGPPHWNSYVAVENADQSAARATELGAHVIMAPFDVMDLGRMAVIADPQGAVFQIWQAGKNAGVAKLGEVGSLCWTELMTTDTDGAAKFYTGLLPWRTEAMPMPPPMTYTLFKRGDQSAGGMMGMTPDMPAIPPHWLPYFSVADCDATFAKATAAGAKPIVPPRDIPGTGRFAIVTDPQGAGVAFIQMKM